MPRNDGIQDADAGKLATLVQQVVANYLVPSKQPIQGLCHIDNPLVGLARGALLGRFSF